METQVLVTGCFNVLHAGHVRLLEFASKLGRVTVGINTDPYLVDKYGDLAVPMENRIYCLRSCRYVDEVVVFGEDHPGELILRLKPAYYVKGPDYAEAQLPEQYAIDLARTRLVIHHTQKEHSAGNLTRSLIKKIDF